MGIATSRVRLMLRELCASGEDRGDIDIDTEVLKEIAPLAQDRRARNSHHLAIVAGRLPEGPRNLGIPLLPPFDQVLALDITSSPQNGIAAAHVLLRQQERPIVR